MNMNGRLGEAQRAGREEQRRLERRLGDESEREVPRCWRQAGSERKEERGSDK